MPTRSLLQTAIIAVAAMLSAGSAHAGDPESGYEPHVRTSSPPLRSLIDETAERSPTFRALVDQIDGSNVIVFVEYHLFTTANIDGRLAFLAAAGGRRYLVIQIACLRTRNDQFAILGHELRHAAEIAAAPSIVDVTSLAQHYETIGFVARQLQHGVAFETRSAVDFGARVQREVLESIHAEEAQARAAHEMPGAERAMKVRDGS